MKPFRRFAPLLVLAFGLGLGLGLANPSAAADYPSRQPISFLVGFGAGGSTDIIARMLAPRLQADLGQSVVVENRPGASGSIAAEALVRAPADGYAIMACTNSILTTHRYLFKDLRFDADQDILPVSQITTLPYILLVNPGVEAKTAAEFVALARREPGKLSYGSSGPGSAGHLAGEMFSSVAGIKMSHVPYKGSGQAMTDLVAGHIQAAFDQEATVGSYLANGRLRALGIAAPQRSATLPELPTLAELGLPFEAAAWTGICVRRGTPDAIVERIAVAVRRVMAEDEVRARFLKMGMGPLSTSPAEFAALVRRDSERLGQAIRALGISAQ